MDDFAQAMREHDPKAAKTAQLAGGKVPGPDAPEPSAVQPEPFTSTVPVLVSASEGPIPPPAAVVTTEIAPKPEPSWIGGHKSVGAHTTLSSITGQMQVATEVMARRRSMRILTIAIAAGVVAVVISVLALRSPARPAAKLMVAPVVAPSAPAVLPIPEPVPPTEPPAVAPLPIAEALPAPVPGKKGTKRRLKGNPAPAANPIVVTPPTQPPAPAAIPTATPPPGAGPKPGGKW